LAAVVDKLYFLTNFARFFTCSVEMGWRLFAPSLSERGLGVRFHFNVKKYYHKLRIVHLSMHKQLLTKITTLLIVIICGTSLMAQPTDPTLFSVNGTPILVSEFTGIYTKTNQDKADFSRASLEEYLDLYTRFKLKVAKARELHLDTLPALKAELEGYRRQLAGSYLVDKEVTDGLVREAHDRMLKDIELSHVFVSCDKNASSKDTLRAYQRAMRIYQLLRNGRSDFEKIALDSSEDKTVKDNKGYLGYVTAMLPDGYYALETALYRGKPGDIVGPIRSGGGYHIIKIGQSRPARGEIEVGQILIRKGDTPEKNAAAKVRIDSIYAALQAGAKWEEICAKTSEDQMTAPKGGYVGFFGINRYQKNYEDAAFAIAKDGDYTRPIETTIGWHIIKRVSARPVANFETMKRPLTEKMKREGRSEVAKQTMISRIQREGKFTENSANVRSWTAQQTDSIFHTYKWKPDPAKPQTVLFSFGNTKSYTVADFEEYCQRASRERMRGKGYPVDETIGKLYKSWKDEAALQFEETQLSVKYPEFRALMREYEEGMLLFEVAKMEVWDRANADSTGLEQYFNANLKSKYNWDERAKAVIYTVKSDDPSVVAEVRAMAAKKPSQEVAKHFNAKGDVIATMERTYEKGKNKDLDPIWGVGNMTNPKSDAGTKTTTFVKIESMIPPGPKALSEARGYAVADYQDFLEKKWVDDLRKKYPIEINKSVFESLIKKK
jgi:peptidyl-prolyl cis-trans isomerase SurA